MVFQTKFTILIFLTERRVACFPDNRHLTLFSFFRFLLHSVLTFCLLFSNRILISIKFRAFPYFIQFKPSGRFKTKTMGETIQLCHAWDHGLEEHITGFSGSLDNGLCSREVLCNGSESSHRGLIHEICL